MTRQARVASSAFRTGVCVCGGGGGTLPNARAPAWPTVCFPRQGYFYQGGQGALPPPRILTTQKGPRFCVTCGTIIRRVVAAARCKSSVIDFWIFFKYFVDVLWDIWTSEPRGIYRKVHNFFKRSEICFKKRSKISNAPPPPLGNLIKISLPGARLQSDDRKQTAISEIPDSQLETTKVGLQ